MTVQAGAPATPALGGRSSMASNASKEQLFDEVSATCNGLISRIALSYEADPALRRELIQDILLAIWVALPSYRGDASLRTFVAAIAQKRSISHVAKRAREPRQVELPADLISGALAPDEVAVRNDLKKRLVESIQLLSIPSAKRSCSASKASATPKSARCSGSPPTRRPCAASARRNRSGRSWSGGHERLRLRRHRRALDGTERRRTGDDPGDGQEDPPPGAVPGISRRRVAVLIIDRASPG